MTVAGSLRRRLVLGAAGLGAAVALAQVAVVHLVIDTTADEALAERVEGYTVWSSIAAGLVMVLLAAGLAAWVGRRALEPVGRMARTATEWSQHDLDRRFALGPPTDEIRALGATLDTLLDRVSQVILGEQRLTAELAHELRSPLTTIRATADLVAMRPDLDDQLREDVDDILAACHEMAATMTGLLHLARTGRAHTDEQTSVSAAVAAASSGPDRDRIALTEGADLVLAAPAALAARAIGPVLDNATRLADHVVVRAAARAGWVEIEITDDGPGVPSGIREVLFEPGRSGGSGSGLGLSLARRVARSFGGDVTLAPAVPGAGATFLVRLPAA